MLLRFNHDNYEFRNPFWYDKSHLDQPLCPQYFAHKIAAPISNAKESYGSSARRCLVCKNQI
jgi:hypothetical protein